MSNSDAKEDPEQPSALAHTSSATNNNYNTKKKLAADAILLEIYHHLIQERGLCEDNCMTIGTLVSALLEEGIWFWRDERFQESQRIAKRLAEDTTCTTSSIDATSSSGLMLLSIVESTHLDASTFVQVVSPQAMLFWSIFSEDLVIPDWTTFVTDMQYHFQDCASNETGENAQYIPILREADSDKWGLSLCSTDGQRYSIGDYNTPFSIQSVSKPVTYGLCLAKEGEEMVDEWIGVEPAGRPFNTQDLDQDTHRPFNASVNTGAIMAAGLFASRFPHADWEACVSQIRQTWSDMSGHDGTIGFSRETYESEKATAYNNIAIAYNLKGRRGLPRNVDLQTMLDVYLGCCSIEMTAEGLAVAAATFANGGVCPITRQEVFPPHVIRHVLAETMTCGMYNQAGRFAVNVGLPAKSGVSGALLVIVPNLMGLATFSPRLNKQGNSVRGLDFCKAVVSSHRVHIFEPLRSGNCRGKIDPRSNGKRDEKWNIHHFALAYQVGDAWGVRLHDIFVYAMAHVAVAAQEGLSDRMIKAIGEEYQLIYQDKIDPTMVEKVLHEVQQNPNSNMETLKALKKDRFIADEFRQVILFAIMEILMVDNNISDAETKVVLEITSFLGVDPGVVMMELNRHKHQIGARFKEADPLDTSHSRSASLGAMSMLHLPRPSVLSTRSISDLDRILASSATSSKAPSDSKEATTTSANEDGPMHPHSEVLRLRREVYHLNRQLEATRALLQEAKSSRTSEDHRQRLSILPRADA